LFACNASHEDVAINRWLVAALKGEPLMAEICFEFNGKRICIPIYYAIPVEWWKPPEPDPDPWRRDIFQIAIINQLTKGLSERVRVSMQQAVMSAAKEIQAQLPRGMELHLEGHPQPRK
jgi:hypothetical protein